MVTTTDEAYRGPVRNTGDFASGIATAVVQPNGTVVVTIDDGANRTSSPFRRTTAEGVGRAPWRSRRSTNTVNGGFDVAVASATVDGAGNVFVVCGLQFPDRMSGNDIVMSVSSDGAHWSQASRIPIDSRGSTVDHFIPGIAADPATSGSNAHLGLTYYFYRNTNCSNCSLRIGFISSPNGGRSWRLPKFLTAAFNVTWLANTDQGYMVGDYQSTSYAGGKSRGLFAIASAPSGGVFNEAMFTRSGGQSDNETGPLISSFGERRIPFAHSDHPPRRRPIIVQ